MVKVKQAKVRTKRTFFQKLRRLCLWLLLITLPLVLGIIASSPWWVPMAVERLLAEQFSAAGIDGAEFKVTQVSLNHLELSEFSGQWKSVRFDISRLEAQFTLEQLRQQRVQSIGVHSANLVFESLDEESPASFLTTISHIPAESFFMRESTVSWETYSTREPTVFAAECIVERNTEDGSRFWTRLESNRNFLEISGRENSTGDTTISFETLLNMPLLQLLAPVTLPRIPFMQGMTWADIESRRGRLKAEGRVDFIGGEVDTWAVLGDLTNLSFQRSEGDATASISLGARGRGESSNELWLKASGKTRNTSASPQPGDPQQQTPRDRHRLEYDWDVQLERKAGQLTGQINLGFENSTLLLDTAAPRLRIYGISGATKWLLQGDRLSSSPTTLMFNQAELPGVTMRSGELTLPESINLKVGTASAILSSSVPFSQFGELEERPVDGEIELEVRLNLATLFPAAGKALKLIESVPTAGD